MSLAWLAWLAFCVTWLAAAVDGTAALARARSLAAEMPDPHKASKNGGEVEAYEWWEQHASLFEAARFEYGPLHPELYDLAAHEEFIQPMVHSAVLSCEEAARSGHAVPEEAVRALLQPGGPPGVWRLALFTEHFTTLLREELLHYEASGIPLRRPNGMNRFGAILDQLGLHDSVCSRCDTISGPSPHPLLSPRLLMSTCRSMVVLGQLSHLCRRYLRPIGAMLFPWLIADGTIDEHYGFVVRYKCGEDISLAEHADASVLTLNANLGISGFTGGAVAFRGTRGAVPEAVPEAVVDFADFSAGEAILHLGSHLHEALPLETGERVNLVVWLFAEHGVVRFAPYEKHERLTESERWHPSPNEQAHRRRPRSSTGAKQREWPAGAHAHVEGQAAHVAATLVDAEEAETADWKAAYDEL